MNGGRRGRLTDPFLPGRVSQGILHPGPLAQGLLPTSVGGCPSAPVGAEDRVFFHLHYSTPSAPRDATGKKQIPRNLLPPSPRLPEATAKWWRPRGGGVPRPHPSGIWKRGEKPVIHHLALLPSSSSVPASSPRPVLFPAHPSQPPSRAQEGRTFLGTDGCLPRPAFCQLINAACN